MARATKGTGSNDGKRLAGQLAATSSATSGRLRRAGSSAVSATLATAAAAFDSKQATFLGQFVLAAYSMYEADPTLLNPEPTSDFPAAYDLVAWVHMKDFVLGSTNPLFYGYIARCRVDAKQFVLAIRGTETPTEWFDDALSFVKVPFKMAGCGKVGAGFNRIYDTLEVVEKPTASLLTAATRPVSLKPTGGFAAQIAALVGHRPRGIAASQGVGGGALISVTGHSLGAALATLYVMENAKTSSVANPMICTFGSPLVGDQSFVSAFAALGLTSWRIANRPDVVPYLPPAIIGFSHVDALHQVDSAGLVRPTESCRHAMATYLSLLDASLSPTTQCGMGIGAAAVPRTATLPPAPPSPDDRHNNQYRPQRHPNK